MVLLPAITDVLVRSGILREELSRIQWGAVQTQTLPREAIRRR